MARFAFICPPFLGHINPMSVLARTVAALGHRVVFLHQRDAAPLFRQAGVAFLGLWDAADDSRLADITTRMANPNGPSQLRAIIRDGARNTDLLCRHAPGAIRDEGIDAIVCDQLEPAGGLVARHLGLPLVSIANALPINAEPDIPPFYLGWDYRPTPFGRWRNRGGERIARWIMRPHSQVIEQWAGQWHLGPLRSFSDCLSGTRQIVQAVAGLDFPRRMPPPGFVYAGPFRDDVLDQGRTWEDDGKPFVYCSLGTLQDHRVGVFQKIAEACRDLGLRLVIAHGGGLADLAGGLPGEVVVLRQAPQRAILPKAVLTICHAGFNTVMDSLSFGVPILALPLAFEQPAIAARIARSGAGLAGSARWSAPRLAGAIETMLVEPGYGVAAERLRLEIDRAGGAGLAADLTVAAAA